MAAHAVHRWLEIISKQQVLHAVDLFPPMAQNSFDQDRSVQITPSELSHNQQIMTFFANVAYNMYMTHTLT